MAFLDDLKKKAAQTVQAYANSAEGQKRLSEYNASNAKKSTVSSVKNTVQKTFQPITDLTSKAMPKMESNWYKGSKPTQRETLARIYEVGNQDPSKRESLMQMYQAELNDPTSPIYNPYTSATTTSLSKTNLNNTLKAQQEWEELTKELAWWAQHPSRNYSDDEIVERVNWKNYPTLAKMDAGRESGSPLALTDAVGYSKDAMYGVLWAARNPNKSTGDYMLDAVQSVLGRGKQYQPDEKTANRLNPMSEEYNPYAVGSTMDELAYKYGVYSFDQEWLDNNRHMIANPDTNADYGKIYKAVQNTAKLNDEAKAFGDVLKRYEEAGLTPDIDSLLEQEEYGTLRKMQESLKSGQLLDTTAAIDFDPYVLQQDVATSSHTVNGDYTTDAYDQMLSDNMGGSYLPDESKQNSEELRKLNTDVTLPEYIPVATEHELRAFKTTANAGYSDVVYTTADLITNGTGGAMQANAAQQKAAHAYANKNLFDAWDALNDEVGFTDVLDEDEQAFLQKYFPEKYAAGELPTTDDFGLLDMAAVDPESGKTSMDVWQEWETMRGHAESVMADMADRKTAADTARQTVADVMDDLAEVYGEGTDQYNAAVATYEMAYAYTRGVPKVWRAYDAYQDASAEGPITVEYGNSILTNQRGSNARDLRVLNALIENAEIMGLPEQYVKNMRQQAEDLKAQNDLLNAHKLQENEDYDQQVAAFNAQYQPYKPAGFFSKPSHAEVVMHAVYDPESAIALGAAEKGDTVMLAMSMTPEERDNYKYKFMTEGEESATAYFDALSENLYVRSAEERSERTQEWASANEWNSALATVGSVAMTPLEGFSALATVVSELQGKDINPYSPTFFFSQAKSDLRTGTKKGFEKAYGDNKVLTAIYNTFYDALTSAADSGISTLMGGKYGSMILGLSGFNSAVMDASMRGASDERAIIYGMVTAGVEAFTEHSQIDKMLGAFNAGATGVRGFVGELLNSMASEAGEEALSSILGTISDDAIMQSMSNREAAIEQYIATGLTREEAEAQASKDIMIDILYSGLVGGISGGATTSIGYAAGKALGDNGQTAQTEHTEQPTGTPVQRAEAALSTAMQEGVGEAQQTATVAGVLQSFGLSDMEANAAAKNIVGSTNTRVLRKMLSQAEDPAGLIKAIAMGSVSERSRSWAILHNARVDSKNAKEIGEQLISVYNEDANDQSVMTEYDARVAFDAEADATADIIASSGRVDTSALDKAKEQSTNAQLEMDKAEAEVEAAHQAVVEAQDRFNANPSDDKAKQALKNAINLQYKARERSEAAKRNAILAKKHLDKANADFKAQTEANMIAAREQAKAEVQQKQAEQEAQKQEAAKAAEQQREADNVLALEADEFIESHYPNVTDEERKQLRKQYISLNQAKEAPAENSYNGGAELLAKAGKKFGFRVEVTDKLDAEGGYMRDENTIYISKDITQTEAIKRVLLHEMTHAAEGAGDLYNELRETLLGLKYGNNKAQLDADVEATINNYNQFYASRNIVDKKTGKVKQMTKEQAMQELTANVNAEIITGSQKLIDRLVNEKPSVARRIMDTIKNAIAKMAGINDPAIDQALDVVKMFEKALSKAQTQTREFGSDGIQYSIREKEPPKNVVYAYKAFYAKDGKLYPPMVSNITDDEDKQKVKNATSKTMNSLPTPVGVWLDADIGGIAVDDKGVPERTKDTGRLRVKNDKGGGSLAFRPGWHLGEWPDAKQFNKGDLVAYVNYEGETKTRRMLMPDDLVFAKCEVSADVDYQLDALSYGISDKGSFSRSQAGLPYVPDDGFYKYRTNVDPTTAPWLIAGSIKVVEILDDDDCARICAEFGVTPDKRESGKKIDLSEYGLKRGAVEESTEGMERFKENDANRANKKLLQDALNDPAYKDAYVQRDIDFNNKKQYKALQKEFEMNGQDIEEYRKLYEERGFASKLGDMQFSINRKDVELDELTQYNRYGWIRANDVLSPNEWRILSSRLTMHEDANFTEQRNLDGDLMIESRDDDNNFSILAITDDDSTHPTVKRIYRFNFFEDPKLAKGAKKNLEKAERTTGDDVYRIAIPYMAAGVVEVYDASDYRKRQQNFGRSYSNDSNNRGIDSDSEAFKNGRGSNHGSGREVDVTSDGQLSLPSPELLRRQMASYHASRTGQQEQVEPSKSTKLGASQFAAQTGQNTSVLSDDVKDQLRKSPFYQKTSERQNMDIAINNIEIEGYETRRNKLLDGSINLFTPEGQVEAFVLAKAAKEAGDVQGESAIAFKVKESGTLLGQSLAMRRMYLEMTPEGKTQFLQRTVDKINQDYANQGKSTRVVLPEWVEARLEEADGDEEAIAKVVDRAYTDIAEQMPPDWKSRLNAWRYTAMLANPRTHIRNIAGNLMFMPAVSIKNKIGAVAEMVFAAPDERTKTFAPVRQEYKDFAVAQLEDVKDALTGGGKHNPMSEIQSRRRDFNTKALEWLSKGNGKLLEKEDAFFLNKHFVNALSGFLQARNVDVTNVDANTLQAGLDYAVLEAQKATYRDASELADKLSKFTSGLSNSKKRSARAAGLLVEGALPFKKTPINVMRRGIEYSPIGLLNTLTVGMRDMQQGNIEKSEFLDRLAGGLTGTGLAAVGFLLYNLGNLKLSLDEPEDELEKLSGAQEYSIELFGKSFTIDWLSPSAMPLFVGGAIAELFEKDGEGFNLNTVTDALMNIAEPVFNLSMLDGVNSLLSAASNSENGVADIVIRAAESYATQFVPTVLGAFARTLDPVRRTTYTDKNSSVPSSLQYISDSVVNKIPGASYAGQPYLNAWGEEDTTESIFMRAVENFLSPGYINDLTTDDVEKGLMELYDETKEPGLVPKLPQKYFTVNKQRKDLTGEEYERLVKERGQTAKSLHEQLFGNPYFLNLPAKYQVYALEQVWEYATQTAKQGVAPEYETDSWVAASKNPADSVLEKTLDKAKKDRSTEMKNSLYSAIDSGDLMNAATYVEGIMQGGTEKGGLRTSITNHYKSKYQQMYADGDIEGMRQLENTLLALNVGYKLGTIQKWIVDIEE